MKSMLNGNDSCVKKTGIGLLQNEILPFPPVNNKITSC